MSAERSLTCAEVADDLSELALGALSGRPRAQVLTHVAACVSCRDELRSLSAASDALLVLAPSTQPPVGFEQRLAQRLAIDATPVRGRRRRLLLTLAALVLVIAGVALGVGLGPRPSASTSGAPQSASLVGNHHALGHVWVSAGRPAWIYMTLDDPSWSGTVWCSVTLNSGRVVDVGAFTLAHGQGAWSAQVDATGADVRVAEVTAAGGVVVATARLSA